MKILITGGAGYIGSHTIIKIIESTSWNVISADNYINSTSNAFKRIKKITDREIKNYEIDLCDFKETKKIFSENPDITGVIHFAALKSVPESVANPDLYYKNNNESLNTILSCVKEFNVRNLIFSSSCSVYGNINTLPVNEMTPLQKANSPYGDTKQQGEKIIENFSVMNPQINFISLRYFNPVGAHMSGLIGDDPKRKCDALMPGITETAIGISDEFVIHGTDYKTRDGSCIRDYIHVSDIANAHVLALKYLSDNQNGTNYDVFNLGFGNGISVLEAIQAFEKVSGKRLKCKNGPRRAGDVEAIYSDSTKAKKILKWSPKYKIEQMMESAWKWEQNKHLKLI